MATRKTATKKTPAMKPAGVSVRMYRQGLGDCFLLSFPRTGQKPFRMLIDCGVVLGTPDPTTPMKRVVNDLITETGGQIDLLVATHEHWDHVSGFNQAQDEFNKLAIRQVWVAWTEDPADALANKLRAERRTAENALRMAVHHLALAGDSESAQRVDSLVNFFGASAGSTSDALDYVKKRAPNGQPRYCEPGEPPIELGELPGVRFYIMGPPKNEALIKKSNPGQNEAYGLDAGAGGSQALLVSGFMRATGATAVDERIEDPFDATYTIPLARAQQMPFFEQRYFGNGLDTGLAERGFEKGKPGIKDVPDQAWRRIDTAWMGAAETMALQLDSATNNTSLVLAIEIVATGQILLFPGDAQAGNWLSWQDLKFPVDGKTVTGPELLARTSFYKVGHHGSHNATLKAKGLELMVNDAMIAMIPVDHEMAVKKHWGMMPLPDLVDRIRLKTHGRVLKVDDAARTIEDLIAAKPEGTDAHLWQAFTDRVHVTDLFYELSL